MNTKKAAARLAGKIPSPLVVYGAFEVGLRAVLRGRFKKLEGLHETIQFRISNLPSANWHLIVEDGKATLRRGEAPYPTGIMTMSARTFRDLAVGRTDPAAAALKGELHATGTLDRYRILEAILGRRR